MSAAVGRSVTVRASLAAGCDAGKRAQGRRADRHSAVQAEGAFDINTVFAGILVLTAFALALDAVVSFAERRLLVWRPQQGETEKL